MSDHAKPARRFVPPGIDLSDVGQVVPAYQSLLDRPLTSAADLDRWLLDLSELAAAADEHRRRRYVDKSRHTDDAELERRYLHVVRQVEPAVEPVFDALQRKFLSAVAALPPGARAPHAMLVRQWQAGVELFSEANLPLEAEVATLVNQFNKLTSAMTVDFDGAEQPLRRLERYAEHTDRDVRRRAWEAATHRAMRDRDALDDVFDQLLTLRHRVAANVGLDFRAYTWKWMNRFDYTPADCVAFADAIERTVVPLVGRLRDRRRADLGLPSLRPWDLAVDPLNRPPLVPFAAGDVGRLVDGVGQILARLSPELAGQFESIRRAGHLDLDVRAHKQNNGYCTWLAESRQPFIFMLASGVQRNVLTLLHEAGHAFHGLAAADRPFFLQRSPLEFGEVASLSLELLGGEHLDAFYAPADAARARRVQLEQVVVGFLDVAMIDSFQHWLYEHPGHTRGQRAARWLQLHARFGGTVDWSGLEDARAVDWQTLLHPYYAPFYFVEYGIAQLGALQLWQAAKADPHRAMADCRAALSLGGSRPLPDLFAAAGIRFDFSKATLAPLMAAVGRELDEMPG